MSTNRPGSYFAPLADLLSPAVLDAAGEAVNAYNHQGAGRREEPALMHGIRALVEALRAEEQEKAAEQVEAKHAQLKHHYDGMEASVKAAYAAAEQRMVAGREAQFRAYQDVHRLVLGARAAGRKTLPLDQLVAALGLGEGA